MKLPNKVNICGKVYSVASDHKDSNSHSECFAQEMIVGVKGQSAERRFDSYLHEVIELVACEQKLRFDAADDEHVFVMNHKQFDHFASDVAAALYPMVK